MSQRQLQRRPAALGVAHHRGPLDVERIEDGGGVVAELLVGQRPRRVRAAAVTLLIEHDHGRSATKRATHCAIESVARNAPGMSSNGTRLASPRSPYTSW